MMRAAETSDLPAIRALLDQAFAPSGFESKLVAALVENGKAVHHWVTEIEGEIVAYIAYTRAYRDETAIGYHLAPVAVRPDSQNRGLGSELIAASLEQEPIRGEAVYVLGHADYYPRFGFVQVDSPVCPFDENNEHFMALNDSSSEGGFTIGYESEFSGE